jgi:hypothetical protein
MHSRWCDSHRLRVGFCNRRAEAHELLASQESYNFSVVPTASRQILARGGVGLDCGRNSPGRAPNFLDFSGSVGDSFSGAEEFTHHLVSMRRNHEWI